MTSMVLQILRAGALAVGSVVSQTRSVLYADAGTASKSAPRPTAKPRSTGEISGWGIASWVKVAKN